MITIRDIARLSGYSIGTVSRVINDRADVSDEAREKIERIIREYDYRPNSNARKLKQSISSEVSVIVCGSGNVFLESVLEQIQVRMREYGETVNVQFIGGTENEVTAAIQTGHYLKPKGIIFLGGSAEAFRSGFSGITLPSVLVTVSAKGLGFGNLSSFTTDYVEAGGCAVGILLAQGHRRIGIIGGRSVESGAEIRNDKIRGAAEELERSGIAFDFARDHEGCALSAESGYAAAEKLLRRSPDLTGIFAVNDAIAFGAMRAFEDMGLSIPGNISLVGFDGINYTRYSNPRLATIRQDVETLARKSVDDLLMRISYGCPAVHELVPYECVNGESVAPPRK